MDTENIMNKSRNILIIDDELEITKALVRQFKRRYTVFSATNTVDAFRILENENIHVIISDQRMPGMTGVEFFTSIKATYPDCIKLILSGYSDIEAVVSAINLNQVFRYIYKPWNPDELDSIINEAFEKYELQAHNRELVNNLIDANIHLEEKVTLRTQELEQQFENLKKSEERFQMLFNKAPLGYQSMDINGNLIEVNQQWLDTLGYERAEVIGKWFGDFLTPIYQEGFRQRFPVFKAQGHIHSEFEMIHKNGFILFIAFYGKIGNDIHGNFKQTHCILQDVTEVRLKENALRESETQYRNLANSGTALIWQSGIDKLCFYFNEPWLNFTGRTLEQEYGNGWAESVHPDDFDHCLSIYVSSFDKRIPFEMEYRMRRADGEYRWILDLGTPNYNSGGEFVGYIGHCFDITERKEIEVELIAAKEKSEKSEERYALVIEASEQGIWDWNVETNEVFYSEQWKKQIGYTDVELKNEFKTWVEHLHPDDKDFCLTAVQTYLNHPIEHFMLEFRFRHKSGTYRWIHNKAASIKNLEGKVIRMFGSHTDITERKESEIALKESEADFRNLIELSPVAMVVIRDWQTLYFNPSAVQLFGAKTQNEIINRHIYEFVHPDFKELAIKNSRKLNEKGFVEMQEQKYLKLDGSILDVETQAKSIKFNDVPATLVVINDITERKKAEIEILRAKEAAEKSKIFLNNIINSIGDPLFVKDEESRLLLVNDEFCKIFGLSRDYVLGKTLTENVTPDERESFLKIDKQVLADGNENINVETLTVDGNETRIISTKKTRFIENNDKKYLIGIIRDLTDAKKAEKALIENEEKYRVLLENSGIGIGVYDLEGKVILFNQKALQNMGGKIEDYIGKSFIELFGEKTGSMYLKRLHDAIKSENSLEYEDSFRSKSGEYWFLSNYTKIKNSEGKIIAIQILSHDITQRKNAEDALRISEERYRSLLKHLETGIVVHGPDSSILLSNSRASELLGLTNEQMQGKVAIDPDWKFVNIDNTTMKVENYPVQQIITSKKAIKDFILGIQHSLKHNIIWVNVNGFPVLNEVGEITEILISFNDISERLQATETIKDKNKELENLIYVASHDLRSPLVNIQGFSQRLENQTSEIVKLAHQHQLRDEIQDTIDKISTVEIPKSLGYIKSNITKMDSLINGLLKLSRTGRILMNINEINMSNLFQSIVNTHQFELSELDAKVEIDSLTNCYGDENQLNQLFSNIIANAIKYRDTNKQLTLRIHSKIHSSKVVYAITDNGIGINKKYLPKIWDIFYRVNPTKLETGEGLGLSVARKITEKHKGKVWVESEVGVGSTFYVELLQNKFEE